MGKVIDASDVFIQRASLNEALRHADVMIAEGIEREDTFQQSQWEMIRRSLISDGEVDDGTA